MKELKERLQLLADTHASEFQTLHDSIDALAVLLVVQSCRTRAELEKKVIALHAAIDEIN